jgi:hypothetical protein
LRKQRRGHQYSKKREIAGTERGKESRKYIGCGDMIAGGPSQGTEIVEEIPQGEPIKLFQRLDSARVKDLLQLLGMDFLDEHEDLLISASSMPEILSQDL